MVSLGGGCSMSWRDPTWMQRGLDAMKVTLDVDAALKQQMIDFLLDEGFWNPKKLSPKAARTKFNACMNPLKPDFFKLSELWALMKRFRRYELWLAMGDDLGFERPHHLPTVTYRDHLQQQLDAQERLRADLLAELEAIDAAEPVDLVESARYGGDRLRVHPAMREVGPHFSLDGTGHEEGGF